MYVFMHSNILHMPSLKETLVAINPNDLFCNLFLNSQFLKLIFIFHLMRSRQKIFIF